MKKKVFYNVPLIAAFVMMLTSCLGDGDNKYSLSYQPGVMRYDMQSFHNVMDVYGGTGTIYNPLFDDATKFDSDGCYMVSFSLDYGIPENSNANVAANGYYTVDLTANAIKVSSSYGVPYVTDTTKLLANEQPISHPYGGGFAYQSGYLFLVSYITQLTDQKTTWELSYDESLESMVVDGDQHIYDLYLRANIVQEGTTPSVDANVPNAYQIESFMDRINSKELAAGKSSYYLRVNYISAIKDSIATWKQSDLIQSYVVDEDN